MSYIGVKPAGITSATQVETDKLNVDNVQVDGNTISSTDTNGDITLDPNGTGAVVVDASIKLDGNYPTGTQNVALGDVALGAVQSGGNYNTAVGHDALGDLTTGDHNTGIGREALRQVTTASENTGVGSGALVNNTSGASNTSVGRQSLFNNTTASNNTAVGYQAGYSGTTAFNNTYVGIQAGYSATTPQQNTFIGRNAGYHVTTGGKNTIVGCYTGNQDGLDMRTLSNYIVLSDGDGNRRFTIRNDGTVGIKDAAFVANGVAQVNVPAAGVAIINADTNGHYRWNYQSSNQNMYWSNGSNQAVLSSSGTWTDASDVAYKKDITDATYGITTVKALQPRFYYMKDDAIEDDSRHLGFIAQELEVHVPEVVTGSDGSKGVEYGHLTAVLTKALQEAVAKIETLETEMTALKARVTALEDA